MFKAGKEKTVSVASMAKLAQNDAAEPANALNLITAYIPSEAIAVYIGALGILIPTAEATADQVTRVRFACFAAGILIAILISFLNFDATGVEAREAFRRRIVVSVLAAFTFLVYAAATPSFFYSNAFLTIAFTQWAAVLALVVAVVLPYVAKALGVRKA